MGTPRDLDEAEEKRKRLLSHAITEFYTNEATFFKNMQDLVTHFFTDKGELKDNTAFMASQQNLDTNQRDQLSKLLQYYTKFSKNPFGSASGDTQKDLENIIKVMQSDKFKKIRKAFIECTILSKGSTQFTSDNYNNLVPLNGQMINAYFVQPAQKMMRYEMTLKAIQENMPADMQDQLQSIFTQSTQNAVDADEIIKKLDESRPKGQTPNLDKDLRFAQLQESAEALRQHFQKLNLYSDEIEKLISELETYTANQYGKTPSEEKIRINRTEKIIELFETLATKSKWEDIYATIDQSRNDLSLKQHAGIGKTGQKTKVIVHLKNLSKILQYNQPRTEEEYRNYLKNLRKSDITPFLTAELSRLQQLLSTNNIDHVKLQILYANSAIREELQTNKELNALFMKLYGDAISNITSSLFVANVQFEKNFSIYDIMRSADTEAISILPMITFSTKTSSFVATDILSRASLDERTLAFEFWLQVAKNALEEPYINVETALAITASLNSSALHRLNGTKAGLSAQGKETLTFLTNLADPKQSYAALDEFYKIHQGKNIIPFTGPLLQMGTFIKDGNTQAENFINSFVITYDMLSKVNKLVSPVRQLNVAPAPNPTFLSNINNVDIRSTVKNEKTLYDLSLKFEPRPPTEDTPIPSSGIFKNKESFIPAPISPPPISSDQNTNNAAITIVFDSDKTIDLENKHGILPILFSGSGYNSFGIGNIAEAAQLNENQTIPEGEIEKRVSEKITKLRNEYNQAQMTSDDNAKNQVLEKIYMLSRYGKIYPSENFSQKAFDKMQERIKKYTGPELESAYTKIASFYRKQVIAEIIFEKNPSTTNNDSVILLSDYAQQIFTNGDNLLANGKNLIDQSPKLKILATIYLMLQDEGFFKIPDPNSPDFKEIQNRLVLSNTFANELSKNELREIKDLLSKPNPTDSKTLMESLPESFSKFLTSRFKAAGLEGTLEPEQKSVEKKLSDLVAGAELLDTIESEIDKLILEDPIYFLKGKFNLPNNKKLSKQAITLFINGRYSLNIEKISRNTLVTHDATILEKILVNPPQKTSLPSNTEEHLIRLRATTSTLIADDLSLISKLLSQENPISQASMVENAFLNIRDKIILEIVSENSPAVRNLIIQRWLSIAQLAMDRGDYFSEITIHNALQDNLTKKNIPYLFSNLSTNSQNTLTALEKKHGAKTNSSALTIKNMKDQQIKDTLSSLSTSKLSRKAVAWMDYENATSHKPQGYEKLAPLSLQRKKDDRKLNPTEKKLTERVIRKQTEISNEVKSNAARKSVNIPTPIVNNVTEIEKKPPSPDSEITSSTLNTTSALTRENITPEAKVTITKTSSEPLINSSEEKTTTQEAKPAAVTDQTKSINKPSRFTPQFFQNSKASNETSGKQAIEKEEMKQHNELDSKSLNQPSSQRNTDFDSVDETIEDLLQFVSEPLLDDTPPPHKPLDPTEELLNTIANETSGISEDRVSNSPDTIYDFSMEPSIAELEQSLADLESTEPQNSSEPTTENTQNNKEEFADLDQLSHDLDNEKKANAEQPSITFDEPPALSQVNNVEKIEEPKPAVTEEEKQQIQALVNDIVKLLEETVKIITEKNRQVAEMKRTTTNRNTFFSQHLNPSERELVTNSHKKNPSNKGGGGPQSVY